MSLDRTAATLLLAVALTACASTAAVTEATLAPIDRDFPGRTTLAGGTTTGAGPTAPATVAVVSDSAPVTAVPSAAATDLPTTSAPTAPALTSPGPTTAVSPASTAISIAFGRAPALTTAPATTVAPAATVPTVAIDTSAPPASVAAVATTTCVSQAFGRGADAVTIKLVEKALHATQNGDFDKLMLDLNQWVANSRTILERKWRQQGFKPEVEQIYYLTFFALGIVCPNYTFLPGELTEAIAPYKAPVGGCLDHVVPLDASAGGVFPNNDIKVIQQALYELNLYFKNVGGTPGTATMAAIYQAVGGGFNTANPLHQLDSSQLALLQVAC